jgi:hypothetical protein
MSSRSPSEKLLVVAFALTFYCLGRTFFEAFVNYRTWSRIGAAEFRDYHRALTPLVAKVMLLPIAVYTLSLVALMVMPPRGVSRYVLGSSLTLVMLAILSSVAFQIPMQLELDRNGLSLPLLDRLIWTDLWLRKMPLGLNALLWLSVFLGRGAP